MRIRLIGESLRATCYAVTTSTPPGQ